MLLSIGEGDAAEDLLLAVIDGGGRRRLPDQIQRIARIAARVGHAELAAQASAALTALVSRPVLHPG